MWALALTSGCDSSEARKGSPDAGCAAFETWPDDDGDGYGANDEPATCTGTVAPGWSATPGDCDDADPAVHPGADETCETAYDDDCDGVINEADATGCTEWYTDADGDGYGDEPSVCTCGGPPDGYVEDGTDCDDTDPGAHDSCWEWMYPTFGTETEYVQDLVQLGDINGDGLADVGVVNDVLSAGFGAPSQWDHAGAFMTTEEFGWGVWIRGIGDVTGDGRDDLAISHGVYPDYALTVLAGPLDGEVSPRRRCLGRVHVHGRVPSADNGPCGRGR